MTEPPRHDPARVVQCRDSGDEVIIATDSGAVTAALFGEYREEVLAFADKVEAFYDGQPPREPAEDEHIPMRLVYSKSTLSTRGCEARMDPIEVFKALANETRLNILLWLKDPGANFGPQGIHFSEPIDLKGGVCVESISERAGISKSTASSYLTMMRRAGLLLSERHGKWTYYRRNEKAIRELARYLDTEL